MAKEPKKELPLQGYHFPGNESRPAAYIEATSIEEATQKFINPVVKEQSPVPPAPEQEEKEV